MRMTLYMNSAPMPYTIVYEYTILNTYYHFPPMLSVYPPEIFLA
jgi:hypothetical protein